MKVLCTNNQKSFFIDKKKVKFLVKNFLKWKNIDCNEVCIHFVDINTITELHLKYFQDPTPTDCISFPIDSPHDQTPDCKVLGEVFICPQIGVEYAKKHTLSPKKEISLYIIHGLLHLIGYIDSDEINEPIMRKEEKSAMNYLYNKGLLLC